MFCGNCGSKTIEGKHFCRTCGQAHDSGSESKSTAVPVPMERRLTAFEESGMSSTQWPSARTEDGSLSAQIRASLAEHKKTTELLCLECGYSGLMGVIRTVKPWWGRWIVIIVCSLLSIAFGINLVVSLIFGLVWGVSAAAAERQECVCPQCRKTIRQRG